MALTKFNFNSFDLTTAASKGLAFNSSANGFETSSAGSMTLIKTLTASSSANLSFVHGSSDVVLDSTYPVYLFKLINIHPASSSKMNVFFRDGGSDFDATVTSANFSSYHAEDDSATSLYNESDSDVAQGSTVPLIRNLGGDQADSSGVVIMYLFNPSSTTFVKHFITIDSYVYGSSYGAFSDRKAGYVNTTTAIDGVKFQMASGNIDAGTIKLYGVKDS